MLGSEQSIPLALRIDIRVTLIQGYHVEKQIFERSELPALEAELDAMLKKAGGANYDMGT